MCGFAGFFSDSSRSVLAERQQIIEGMLKVIVHRGPDDKGVLLLPENGLTFGFRRLSIHDLSHEGHQPMHSTDGRFVIVFNGEIYNFRELRNELESLRHTFKGRSDTEVILAAIVEWGCAETLKRLVGMFAIVLWDNERKTIQLIRDRLGKKPLYYGWQGNTFLFASELKALRAHPSFRAEIDYDALEQYTKFCYVPSPRSIYKGINKLPAGTMLTLEPSSRHSVSLPKIYWDPRKVAQLGQYEPFSGTEEDAIDGLHSVLSLAVRQRMISDVPLGAFLSGGVDSSLVVALMRSEGHHSVQTFTIGFNEAGYDEAESAKKIAIHLGTDHTELYITPKEAQDIIPTLHEVYDEPFSDSSQIPTILVSRLAKEKVTVALSGDGGDELFGGYSRYVQGPKLLNGLGWIPQSCRKVLANVLTSIRPSNWDNISFIGDYLLSPRYRGSITGDRIHKLCGIMAANNMEEIYDSAISCWPSPAIILKPRATSVPRANATQPSLDSVSKMMLTDMMTYLVDDILVKLDRASMSTSLEARAPLLDHRVVEFAWQLPMELKIKDGKGKWILRRLLERYVPSKLTERPKMGFAMPIDHWLRGPLRPWAEELLKEHRLVEDGIFNAALIRQKWEEHLSGRRNWQHQLWNVLMFQQWFRSQHDLAVCAR